MAQQLQEALKRSPSPFAVNQPEALAGMISPGSELLVSHQSKHTTDNMKTTTSMTKARCIHFAAAGLLVWSAGVSAFADYSSTVLSKNPIGYWRFSQTAQPIVQTATNYGSAGATGDGIFLGGATTVPGPLSAGSQTAPSFDGFSGKVEVPFNEALNPTYEFTIEAWVKPSCIDGYNTSWYRAAVRTGGTKSGGGYQIQFDAGNSTAPGVFKFTLWNGSSSLEVFNANLSTTTGYTILATNNGPWAHLVGTWSAADGIGRIYVNGIELTNRTFAYTPNTNAVLRIGAGDTDPSDPWGQSFDPGPISQVAVYDHQLSPAQIEAHYENGTNPAPAQTYAALVASDLPAGYWPLNESVPTPPALTNLGTGGAALDGKYFVNSTAGVAGPQAPNYGGLEADNLAGYVSAPIAGAISVPPVNVLRGNLLTIVAWIKRDGAQMANATIFGRRVPGGEKSAFCFLTANQLAYNWDDNANQYNFDSKLVVPDNVWTLAALVITPSNAVIYMDYGAGVLAATNTYANTTLAGFTHEALIGPNGPYAGRRYNGSVDEVAVFTDALSMTDIEDLRTAAFGSGLFIASQPTSRPVMLGGKAPFTCIGAAGTSLLPMSFQLLKDGVPVGSPGSSATVTYDNVQAADLASNFRIVVSTSGGSVTSSVAGLVRWTIPGTYSGLVESYKPAAYYRFGESSLAKIYDISSAFDGSAMGAVAATSGPVPTGQVGFESPNSAYNIGTATGGIQPVGTPINTNTVTITMWLNPNGAQTAFTGLYYTRGLGATTNNYVGLQVDRTPGSPGTQLSLAWAAAPNPYDWHTGVFMEADAWNFVAVAIAPDNAVMYDYTADYGWQTATISQSFPMPTGLVAGGVTGIGIDPNTALANRYFKGAIDEVAVFTRTLSQDEIQKLAMAGFSVNLSIVPAATGSYQIGWSYGTLEWADSVTGTWTDVPGAVSPSYTYTPTSGNQKYFRAGYTQP